MDLNKINIDRIISFSLYLLLLIIPIFIIFLWKSEFSFDLPVNYSKLGTFGDFFGGVLGSIWSLCGVIIFYSALKEQRQDFKTNKDAFEKQREALDLQIEEFRLQREELFQSRQVFLEQSKTLKQQRMSSIYFSLLELYRKIVEDLNSHCPDKNYFKNLKASLIDNFDWDSEIISCHKKAKKHYETIYLSRKEELSHYYKILYRIFKVVDDSDLDESDKFQFITILRSQLSENEMVAIYYNSHSIYGESLYQLILRYNFLKHLPSTSKSECKGYYNSQSQAATLLSFNNELFLAISKFIKRITQSIREEDFERERVSFILESQNDFTLSIQASELDEMLLEFTYNGTSQIPKIINFELEEFSNYIQFFLYDIFIFSRYQPESSIEEFLFSSVQHNKLTFNMKSKNNLKLNIDTDGRHDV